MSSTTSRILQSLICVRLCIAGQVPIEAGEDERAAAHVVHVCLTGVSAAASPAATGQTSRLRHCPQRSYLIMDALPKADALASKVPRKQNLTPMSSDMPFNLSVRASAMQPSGSSG